nr:hypothetical protein [Bacteroides sp. D20]
MPFYHCCTHRDGSCRNYSVSNNPDKLWQEQSPEPLDQWNDGTSTLHTADPVIAEDRKLFNDKEYQNFRLTGEALTQPGSEAGLLFHTDGESGYE